MTFPIVVESCDGQFAASLVGDPKLRFVGRTRSEALDVLKSELERRVALGELLSLEIDTIGVSDLAGKYQVDPTLRAICVESYAERDSERSDAV
jgi:hypothetical protein